MYGKKIKYYRFKKGLTIEELANQVGLTKAAISQYENDKRDPDENNLKKIADALGVTWIHLSPNKHQNMTFQHNSFRKLQKTKAMDIMLLKMYIEKRCVDEVSLSNILDKYDDAFIKFKKLSTHNDIEYNASEIRKALSFPLQGPIYQITTTLEDLGIVVLSFSSPKEISGLNGLVGNRPYIYFNSDSTIERQRFTLIHEICHLFFKEEDTKEFEKYINALTGHVLISNNDLYKEFGKSNHNINIYLRNSVASKYKIAPSCLVTRLYESNIVSETYYKNFFKTLNSTFGRKNEPSLLKESKDSEQPTKFSNNVYLALSEELITTSKAAELLDVPLYDVMRNAQLI